MTPDERWHWEQGNKYALEGMKVLLALNGGAAIALLTFASHTSGQLSVGGVGRALLAFGAGSFLAVFVFFCAYMTQLFYGNDNRTVALRFHYGSYVVVLLAIISFLAGLGFAYGALP